jgi:hypothetical protein
LKRLLIHTGRLWRPQEKKAILVLQWKKSVGLNKDNKNIILLKSTSLRFIEDNPKNEILFNRLISNRLIKVKAFDDSNRFSMVSLLGTDGSKPDVDIKKHSERRPHEKSPEDDKLDDDKGQGGKSCR